MNFLAKELKLLKTKRDSDELQMNERTKEYIESIKNQLKNIAIESENLKSNKPILMDIPKDADFNELLLWLNSEKIPFTIVSEYRNGSLFINRLSLLVKEIITWINTNG